MKQIFNFMAFFVTSSLVIPLIAVYFGQIFGHMIVIMGSLVQG